MMIEIDWDCDGKVVCKLEGLTDRRRNNLTAYLATIKAKKMHYDELKSDGGYYEIDFTIEGPPVAERERIALEIQRIAWETIPGGGGIIG